jgi:hypothetical protein
VDFLQKAEPGACPSLDRSDRACELRRRKKNAPAFRKKFPKAGAVLNEKPAAD